jgi:Ni/Co efflux regulator RcnB
MKTLITIVALAFATASFAQPAKQPAPEKIAAKEQTNCVTKDKNGKCPPAPKSEKPHAKKVEKKADAPKAEAKK